MTEKSKAKPKLGSGKRFKNLESKLEAKGETTSARLAAWIGRKVYGNEKMSEMASAGRKRKAAKKK